MTDNREEIDCPACGKTMQKIFMSKQGCCLDVCTDGCGGIFFDPNELQYFDEEQDSIDELKEALKNKTFNEVDESEIRVCPLCGNNMVKNYTSAKEQIQIDECYNCGSKFFDNGELEKMREEYASEKDRMQEFLSKSYNSIGSKIVELELEEHKEHFKNRSKFLKLMDKIFMRNR